MSSDKPGPSLGPSWDALTSQVREDRRRRQRRLLGWMLLSLALGACCWLLRDLTGQSAPVNREATALGYGMYAGFVVAGFLGIALLVTRVFRQGPRARDLTYRDGVVDVASESAGYFVGRQEELEAVAREVAEAAPSKPDRPAASADSGSAAFLPPGVRQVRLRWAALAAPVAAGLLLLAAPWSFWFVLAGQYRMRKALAAEGLETPGTVVWLLRSGRYSSRGSFSYTYQYTVGGRTFSATSVQSRERDLPGAGTKVTVTYLPGNPSSSLPVSRPRIPLKAPGDGGNLFLILLTLVCALGGGAKVRRSLLAAKRQLRLARDGVAAAGTVTEFTAGIRLHTGRSRSSRYVPPVLAYTFRTLTGEEIRGRTRSTISGRPGKGSAITILYDPLDPGKNIPLGSLSFVAFAN